MPSVTVGDLTFAFRDRWSASKYDEWSHYRNQFINVCHGVKAVDVVALEPKGCCWLLEVKDYRLHVRTKPSELADEVAEKVRDTLAGLVGAQFCAADDAERKLARQALRTPCLRVVLHVEQPAKHSKLFPRAIKLADVQQRLKQLIKAIDPHPRVVEIAAMSGIPWTVS
jgi:hypothetical protein